MKCVHCKKKTDPLHAEFLACCTQHGGEYVCNACKGEQFVVNYKAHKQSYQNCFAEYAKHMIKMYSVVGTEDFLTSDGEYTYKVSSVTEL